MLTNARLAAGRTGMAIALSGVALPPRFRLHEAAFLGTPTHGNAANFYTIPAEAIGTHKARG